LNSRPEALGRFLDRGRKITECVKTAPKKIQRKKRLAQFLTIESERKSGDEPLTAEVRGGSAALGDFFLFCYKNSAFLFILQLKFYLKAFEICSLLFKCQILKRLQKKWRDQTFQNKVGSREPASPGSATYASLSKYFDFLTTNFFHIILPRNAEVPRNAFYVST